MSERVYLAARYDRREEMLLAAEFLARELGWEITSRWISGNHQLQAMGVQQPADSISADEKLLVTGFAWEDLQDICRATVVLHFTEEVCVGYTRGGRHVEFGFALGQGKRNILIGPAENIFHLFPSVERFETWGDFYLNEIGKLGGESAVRSTFPTFARCTDREDGGICPTCLRRLKDADRELNPRAALPFAGTNQHSPKLSWKGHEVTELQYKILRALEQRRGLPINQEELAVRVMGPLDPALDKPHSIRTQIYRIRKLLKGWVIERHGKAGYIIRQGEDDGGNGIDAD